MVNFKCLVAYDGTDFAGYQRQDSHRTVQGELEKAVEKVFGEHTVVYASGRTDSGVHASGQVINFRARQKVPVDRIPIALNSILPKDVAVKKAAEVPDSFHARKDAIRKTYQYRIYNNKIPSPFWRRYSLFVPSDLDADKMAQAAKLFMGKHDFQSFQSKGSHITKTMRQVTRANVKRVDDMVVFTVSANGFLYNMVRIMAGTLIQVGRNKRAPQDMDQIIQACDRMKAGPTIPPHGLSLEEVEYP